MALKVAWALCQGQRCAGSVRECGDFLVQAVALVAPDALPDVRAAVDETRAPGRHHGLESLACCPYARGDALMKIAKIEPQ